jgi:MFS family permease
VLKLLQQKNVFKLWMASFLLAFGDIFFDFFIIWKIYENSETIRDLSIVIGSSFITRSLFALLSGKIADLLPRKIIMMAGYLICATLAVMFLMIFRLHNVHWIIYILLITIQNFCTALLSTTFSILIYDCIEKMEVIKVQALLMATVRVVKLLGYGFTGLLINYFTTEFCAGLNIMAFLLSAYCYYTLEVKSSVSSNLAKTHKDFSTTRYLLNSKLLINFCICLAILNLIYGYIPVLSFVLIDSHKMNASMKGFISMAMALGDFLGLSLLAKIGNKVTKCFVPGLIGSTISIFIMQVNFYPSILLCLAFASYGFFDSITQPLFSYVILSLDSEVRGRATGLIDFLVLAVVPLGIYLGNTLISYNISLGITVFSAVMFATALFVLLNRNLNNLEIGRTENN